MTTRHGLSKTSLHKRWRSIKDRCLNPNCSRYMDYGGRGITICDEWRNSFENFRDWAFSHGYEESLTIDRINVDGNYEPDNCRWIPLSEQNMNKRNSHFLTVNGETHTLTEWSKITGISFSALKYRLKNGVSTDNIFDELRKPTLYEYDGRKMTIDDWSKELGINKQTLYSRIYKGIPLDKEVRKRKRKGE